MTRYVDKTICTKCKEAVRRRGDTMCRKCRNDYMRKRRAVERHGANLEGYKPRAVLKENMTQAEALDLLSTAARDYPTRAKLGINGDTEQTLCDLQREVHRAADRLRTALQQARPHMRNYPHGDDYDEDRRTNALFERCAETIATNAVYNFESLEAQGKNDYD